MVRSDALEANLRRTSVAVVIPPEQQILLEITAPLAGVHKETEALLRELNHAYVGWPHAVLQLAYRARADFGYFDEHPQGDRAIRVFTDLFARAARDAQPTSLRQEALAGWIAYLEHVVAASGAHLERNASPVLASILALADALDAADPTVLLRTSPQLMALVRALAAAPEAAVAVPLAEAGEVLRRALAAAYAYWLDVPDPAAWLDARAAELEPVAATGTPLELIGHAGLRALAACVRALAPAAQHGLPPPAAQHGLPPPAAQHGLPPPAAQHGLPPPAAQHGLPPLAAQHGLPPPATKHDVPRPSTQHGLPPASTQHGLPPPSVQHGLPPPAELRARIAALLDLPDEAALERAHLELAKLIVTRPPDPSQSALARVAWFIEIIGRPGLAGIHEPALREIGWALADAFRGEDGSRHAEFLRRTFATLLQGPLAESAAALDTIGRIGRAVLATGRPDLLATLIEELISRDFHTPRIAGVSEEWQVRVDPLHLSHVRLFLELARLDPDRMRPLLSSLVVFLGIGGLFVADADLFQRDVSGLLGSAIGPVYPRVKQLLRLVPVFFNEIGAEGELRAVSTRLDELEARRDPLCHFLRKQCHVECTPRLIPFFEAAVRFWATGDVTSLAPFVPGSLADKLGSSPGASAGLREVFATLAAAGPVALGDPGLPARLAALPSPADAAGAVAREKAQLVAKTYGLLCAKYSPDASDLLERVRRCHHLGAGQADALEQAMRDGAHEAAVELVIGMIERLKEVVLAPGETEAFEDIYHKRHIAVGIPSVYGSYHEERFDAMGLSLRLESLAEAMFDRMLAQHNLSFITHHGLEKTARWLRLLLRALRADGYPAAGIEILIAMLERALAATGTTVNQYVNIFQFLARAIKDHLRVGYLEVYGPLLDRIVPRLIARGGLAAAFAAGGEQPGVLQVSERFLRDTIARSFGLQRLDNLVGRILGTLIHEQERLDAPTCNLLMSYNVDHALVPIRTRRTDQDDIIYLGNKGFLLKRMAAAGFPVPYGFVITTEVFRCFQAISAFDEIERDLRQRIRGMVGSLEEVTGKRFGDAERPLLLSVRSGSTVSMPGVLTTFLNVGMTPAIAEGLARTRASAWFAWDSYRRFLQSWGQTFGMPRGGFDRLMRSAKRRHAVKKKAQLSTEAMRELALRYRAELEARGKAPPDDPWDQLFECIKQVLASWDSLKAQHYRRAFHVADEWGTAVVVQTMVFGNLGPTSGSGVLFTRDPHATGEGISLYGDFALQSQGEDVVGGLVETLPISERQRASAPGGATGSLEADFPEVYRALLATATELVNVEGLNHQEIEFTFEGPCAEDLFFLQSRDIVLGTRRTMAAFVATPDLAGARLGVGIGAGGGALCGRLAHDAEDIARLRHEHPGDGVILVRPDTVPEDIALIAAADGLLTAMGGATSHAAVAAGRLGRTCVVGCRALVVDEEAHCSEIAGQQLHSGDWLSINGRDGSIYLGSHPVEQTELPVREWA